MNMPDATLQDQVQDIPLWWLILFLVLASLAGELYRADQRQRITRSLLVRVGVRALAACVIGIITLLYCTHRGMDTWSIGAITGAVSLLGPDFIINLVQMLIKRRVEAQ